MTSQLELETKKEENEERTMLLKHSKENKMVKQLQAHQ